MKYILALGLLVAVVLISGCVTGNLPGAPDGDKEPELAESEVSATEETVKEEKVVEAKSGEVKFVGVIEEMSSAFNFDGEWIVSEQTVVVTLDTDINTHSGPFKIGRCVSVVGVYDGETVTASVLESSGCTEEPVKEEEIVEEEVIEEESEEVVPEETEEVEDEEEPSETGVGTLLDIFGLETEETPEEVVEEETSEIASVEETPEEMDEESCISEYQECTLIEDETDKRGCYLALDLVCL